ncbi:MAG: membrane protein insertase YidC, partial [Kofleriaceae bacterium]
MEGQGKRLLVAVVLALGVLLAFQMFFAKKEPPPPPKAGSAAAPVAMTTIVGTTPTPEKSAEVKRGPEQTIPVAFPGRFDAAFSSYGGVLKSWKLLDPRYERDQTKGELLPALPDTGAFFVEFNNESTIRLPAQTEWIGTKISDTQIRYELKTADVELVKTFTIFPDNYVLKMELSAKLNVPAGKQANQILVVTAYGFQDPDKIEKGSGDAEPRGWASSTMRAGKIVHTPVASVNKWPRYEDKIKWTGFEHPYMLAAYAPHLDATQTASKYTFAREPRGLMRTEIALAPQEVFKPGDAAIKREFVAYLGPKHYDTLDLADSVAGFSTGFKETIDMGWFAFIGRPLLWLLQMFHGWFGNWAIAIVLLTFIVKAATLYWTTKSMRSMKAMAALAPQMKILQEKYKDDRQRQQAETMALYKQHGVNPIAGCLPIILQMPIWFALYRMLSTAGELYNQPFIVGWIDDLTKTDPYHILNILLVVTMFAGAAVAADRRLDAAEVHAIRR